MGKEPVGKCSITVDGSLCCSKQLQVVSGRLRYAEARFLEQYKTSPRHLPASSLEHVKRYDDKVRYKYRLFLVKLGQ